MPAAVPEPTRQFASNVQRAMAERGLTVSEVADRAELSLNHVNLILEGRRKVQLDTLVKLAGALDVAPEQLLDGVEWISDGQGGGEFRARDPGA
ncbi:MAG: helix-turn-helix domain-containing protein [Solirubrobacterales bacterium]